MPKRTRYRSKGIQRLIDLFVILVCISAFVLSLYYFWFDLNATSERTDREEIATVTFKYKIAQRKFSDRVVWERLQQRSPLYNEDTIRTADMAEAMIYFKDGTELALKENSMLQIFYADDRLAVSVSGGNIEVDTSNAASAVAVKMSDDSVVALAAGSKLVAKSDSENTGSSFQLQSGNGRITTKDGNEQRMEKGDAVKVDRSGNLSKAPLSVTSISDDMRILNFEDEAVPVHLEWKKSQNDSALENLPVIIETSRSKDFSVLEESFSVAAGNAFDIPAREGTTYWRIYTEGTVADAAGGRVKVQKVSPAVITSPVTGTEYSYKNELPQICFTWKEMADADHYRLEISETEDFSKIVFKENCTTESRNINSLSEGVYYCRVTPFFRLNNAGYKGASQIVRFKILKKIQLQPPVLLVPADNSGIMAGEKDTKLQFRWKAESSGSKYKILFSEDENFNTLIWEENTDKLSVSKTFTAEELGSGSYFWKVCSSDAGGENLESKVNRLEIQKFVASENRLVYPPDGYVVEESKIRTLAFMWKLAGKIADGRKVYFQISDSADFKNLIIEKNVETGSLENLNLKKGTYFWRVGISSDEINQQAVYTQSRSIRIVPELAVPEMILPDAGETVILAEKEPLVIGWKEVESADFYWVKIVEAETQRTVYENEKNLENKINFIPEVELDSEKVKELVCHIQAVGEKTEYNDERRGKESTFHVKIRRPDMVKLVSPPAGKVFSGLEALKNPVVLEWAEGLDKAESSSLTLMKLQSDGSVGVVSEIENPENKVSFTRLGEGTYYWNVKALASSGHVLDAEEGFCFTVLPVEELEKPVLKVPEDKLIMDRDYLKKNRNIVFEWQNVENATDYTFALYQKSKEDLLKRIYIEENVKKNSIRFRQLNLLDVGDFEWQITAYSHAADGFEEQHSRTSGRTFRIELEMPSDVKIKENGRLYGN